MYAPVISMEETSVKPYIRLRLPTCVSQQTQFIPTLRQKCTFGNKNIKHGLGVNQLMTRIYSKHSPLSWDNVHKQ